MATGVYILVRFVIIFLDVILVAMLVRAVLSWFSMGDGMSPLGHFVFVITEPFILPVRLICAKFGWFQGLPLDMSFFITNLLLLLVNTILSNFLPM